MIENADAEDVTECRLSSLSSMVAFLIM
jgi:hypothetical protein